MTDTSKFFLWDNTQSTNIYGSCIEIKFVKIPTPIMYKLLNIKYFKWKIIGYLFNFEAEATVERIKSFLEKQFPGIIIETTVRDHTDFNDQPHWGDIKFILTFKTKADEAYFLLNNNITLDVLEDVWSVNSLRKL